MQAFRAPWRGSCLHDHGAAVDIDNVEWLPLLGARPRRSGFGGPKEGQPFPHLIPASDPDRTLVISTWRQQALRYRQSDDHNLLHVAPAAERAVGFPEPILHGLCTYGICQRAVLGEYANFAPDSIQEIGVRFANVVFPGESIRIDLWQDGSVISFEAFVDERNVKVIGSGRAVLR